MAKTSPAEFISQVRQEASRVTWPSRKEVFAATSMVLVMIVILSLFFLLVDVVIANVVRFIVGF